jgi:two-component system, chemotaxis family, chemotaxis protein CheY
MSGEGQGKSLLLVEDNDLTRELFTFVLEGRGYTVAAPNGLEALGLILDGYTPDCIVLDLRMPVMDGRQFRARQLDEPALADIPVLLLSAERSLPREAAELRAAGYLQKPVAPDDLLTALRACCGGWQAHRVGVR